MWTTFFFALGGFALGAYAMRVYTNTVQAKAKNQLNEHKSAVLLTPTAAPSAHFQDV